MGRESNKRHVTWFTKPKPRTLGQVWQQQQSPRGGQESGSWRARDVPMPEMHEPPEMPNQIVPPPPARRRWPSLPAWPPLPKNVPVVSGHISEDTAGAPTISPDVPPYTEQEVPLWDQPYRGVPDLPYEPPSTFWQRLRAAPRRLLIGLAAGAVTVLLLCSVLSAVALGNVFSAFTSPGGNSIPGGGITSGQSGLATADATSSVTVTPTATLSPATATPVSAFAVTFTCASGNIGGTGQVCIHTQPNAIVSLSVRYCDGSYAQGKSLRGTSHTDGNGDYTWRWNVTTHCAGTATATVMAKSNGLTLTQSTTFTVAR